MSTRRAPRPLSPARSPTHAALAPATPLARVQGVWERSTGPAIAAAARPDRRARRRSHGDLRGGRVGAELDLMAAEMIPRLNARSAPSTPRAALPDG